MGARTILTALSLAGVTAAVAAGSLGSGLRADASSATSGADEAGPAAEAVSASALERARSLPLAQLVGQRLIASYSGTEPPDRLLRMVERGRVAGVIFFGGNINEDRSLVREVIVELQEVNEQAGPPISELPLLTMTDQEGGEVRRLPGAPFQSEFKIGRPAKYTSGRKALRAGNAGGENLAGVGMNVNLAPVLGVQRSKGGFLGQFQRSYGPNGRRVSLYGANFIAGLQSQGVAATSKHFPGLGAARRNQDTDARPVTIRRSRQTLRSIDMVPFGAAAAAGTELVMLNHARYPALDRKRPASLSSRIVRGELRSRLGYDGVTITDALEAGALEPFGGIGRRALLAASAGNDLLLASAQTPSEAAKASRALHEALRSGRLQRGPFERAAARVIALREGLPAGPTAP